MFNRRRARHGAPSVLYAVILNPNYAIENLFRAEIASKSAFHCIFQLHHSGAMLNLPKCLILLHFQHSSQSSTA